MLTFLDSFKKLLETITKISIPPTFVARTLFMFTSNIVYGMSFITNVKFIDSSFINLNNLDYSQKVYVCENDINNFVLCLSIISLKLLNQDLKSNYLNLFFINDLETEIINSKEYQIFLNENNNLIESLSTKIKEYYEFRNNDNWKDSNNNIDLPNGDLRIDPFLPMDFKKIQDYKSWCPLKDQKMIGSSWGRVPGLIDKSDFDYLEYELIESYKQINIESEAKQVLVNSLILTDEQKCIAEFWAGIGNSVTPPGFWNLFMVCCFRNSNNNNYLEQVSKFYELNCGLFQVSLVIWNIKYKCLQARPIQTIKYLFPNEEIDYYFGNTLAKNWLPYQESRLWTPPFPDYLSGHSGFSSTGAYFLTKFFGSDISKENIIINSEELKLLSPIFKNFAGNQMDLSQIVFEKNCSNIESGTPNEQIYLKFNTWEEMAESAGMSRIYGGIHYISSNLISLDVGKKVSLLINNKFNCV